MKVRRRIWMIVFAVSLGVWMGRAAAAQQPPTPGPNAPTAKGVNITEIDVSAGLSATGTSFGSGFTGPTVGLSITTGGITNTMLAAVAVTTANLANNAVTSSKVAAGDFDNLIWPTPDTQASDFVSTGTLSRRRRSLGQEDERGVV